MIIYYTLSGSSRHEDSHRLLKEAIANYTNDREEAGALMDNMRTTKNGKPYITGFDHFSISHSKKVWAVLFNKTECGLDIQHEKKCDVLSIARRWYNPIDVEAVESAVSRSEEDGKKEFFRLWARREALVKALGSTVWDASLPPVSGNEVSIDGREYVLTDIDFADEEVMHAAICIRKEEYEDSDGGSGSVSGKPHAHRL